MSSPPRKEILLNEFFKSLVKNVGMKVVAGPTSVYVDEPGNEGLTGTVTLATSHASIHIWDKEKPAMFQFDLYSCSEFTPNQIFEEIDYWFGLDSAHWVMFDRNGDTIAEIDRGYIINHKDGKK
jgi:S-adenosylmethionine/arginine decarboxylase-like enzyme